MEERNALAYNVAIQALLKIRRHLSYVEEYLPGYFMEVENIRGYTSFIPAEWYLNSDAAFEDLSSEDRLHIEDLLKEFSTPDLSTKEIERICLSCGAVSEILTEKVKQFGLGALAD